MAILKPENVSKTVDTLGRITIPKGLRDRLFLNNGSSKMEIYTMELDGRIFICLTPEEDSTQKGVINI